jgi:hypothetical protein
MFCLGTSSVLSSHRCGHSFCPINRNGHVKDVLLYQGAAGYVTINLHHPYHLLHKLVQSNLDCRAMTPYSSPQPLVSILLPWTYPQLLSDLPKRTIILLTSQLYPDLTLCQDRLLASSPDVSPGKVTFLEADFFNFSAAHDQLFDLVYDYT